MAHLYDELHDAVEQRRDSLVGLTRDLIAFPTVNPPGRDYIGICRFLEERLQGSGFEVELVRAKGAIGDCEQYPRWNLLARHDGRPGGDCIHFNSHVDVVPAGSDWTRDPFAGAIENGKIYGRGSCDMKGGLATSIVAAEAFLACVPDYAGAIEISATCDEESGGYAGVAWLAENGYISRESVQHVIIPEPLNKNRICLGHRGVLWVEIETFGRIAHGCMPFLGDCAVRHMGAVLDALELELMPRLDQRRTSMPVVPEEARRSTLNINSIHGGQPSWRRSEENGGFLASCVPDRCRITVDRRFLEVESISSVKAELVEILENVRRKRPGFNYELTEMFAVSSILADKASPVAVALGNSIQTVLGVDAEHVVSPGTYDQKHFDRIAGISNCVAYGPGILDLAHQPDEWIGVDDMIDGATIMAQTMARLLSVP
ncbi:MAG: acetylornithine deacetylase/succinyl-diaminopimelate desuccinylase family protein [Rhodobacteraceae bacterium]|nr:acetylornithine deacetylase/succinyl-diaminopimelate desuccinylase family protein [Paracoccaceae bacterium]